MRFLVIVGFGAALNLATADLSTAYAGSGGVETAGQAVAVAIPIAAGGISLFKSDYDGILQLSVSTIASYGTAIGLKSIIRERRPDGSDYRSFPSESTSGAFAGATYLQRRYGWTYGLPAFALASFVGYSRVASDRHHWYDVVAGAAIGWGWSALLTDRHSNVAINVTPGYAGRPLGFGIFMRW